MIDWRTLAYQKLTTDLALAAVVPPAFMFGAGGIDKRPDNSRFLVITFGQDLPAPVKGVVESLCQVWVHDEPGDYLKITEALGLVKSAFANANWPGYPPQWSGDSPELTNQDYHTFVRFSSFILRGSA